MIELFAWPTPNAFKISIAFEEMEVPHRAIPVDIGKGAQHEPAFRRVSPNGRMPALVDHAPVDGGEPLALFESGAILQYLGDKAQRFFPTEARARSAVLTWLFWQASAVGPMFGTYGHFARHAPEKIPYAIDRYASEARRLVDVLDARLAGAPFVAGDYSIADMAIFPWVRIAPLAPLVAGHVHVERWLAALEARSPVQRGLALLKAEGDASPFTVEARRRLFGG